MFKKKLIAIAAAATITVSLCACSGSGGGSSTASQASTEAASSAAEESTQGDSSSGNKYIAKPKFIQDDEVNIKETSSKDRFCYNTLNDKEKLYYEKVRTAVSQQMNAFYWNNRECLPETAQKIIKYVAYDYPEYFWYSDNGGSLVMATDKVIQRVKLHYGYNQDEIKDIQAKIDEAAKTYTESAKDLKTDYDKSLNAYEYIIKNTELVTDKNDVTTETLSSLESDKDALSGWNISGVLVNKKANDRGFTQTYQYLMNLSGIECGYVKGNNQFWNIVKLDGEWYCTDVASGKGSDGSVTYEYFNVTSEKISELHKADEDFGVELPECTATKNAYKNS